MIENVDEIKFSKFDVRVTTRDVHLILALIDSNNMYSHFSFFIKTRVFFFENFCSI